MEKRSIEQAYILRIGAAFNRQSIAAVRVLLAEGFDAYECGKGKQLLLYLHLQIVKKPSPSAQPKQLLATFLGLLTFFKQGCDN